MDKTKRKFSRTMAFQQDTSSEIGLKTLTISNSGGTAMRILEEAIRATTQEQMDLGYLGFLISAAWQVAGKDLKTLNTIIEPTVSEILNPSDMAFLLKAGMICLCNVAKPIDSHNHAYLGKRWKAFVATANAKGIVKPNWGDGNRVKLEILVQYSAKATNYLVLSSVVPALLAPIENDSLVYLRAQVLMIFRGAGMTMFNFMNAYARKPSTLAITLPPVSSQVIQFKAVYDEVKNKLGANFEFARTISPQDLIPLQASRFPDLYMAANLAAVRRGYIRGVGPNKFLTANHPTIADKADIVKLSRWPITGSHLLDSPPIFYRPY